MLLDPWPCPADAEAQLRAVAEAWTTHPGGSCHVDAAADMFVGPDDAAAAAALGARLRRIGTVERWGAGARAWRGVAALPAGRVLACVPEGHWAAVVGDESADGMLVAAPAASWRDAAALVAQLATARPPRSAGDADADPEPRPSASDAGACLVRLRFAHAVPAAAFVATLLADVGLPVRQLPLTVASPPATVCWADVSASTPALVAPALAALHRVHRVTGHAWPVLSPLSPRSTSST